MTVNFLTYSYQRTRKMICYYLSKPVSKMKHGAISAFYSSRMSHHTLIQRYIIIRRVCQNCFTIFLNWAPLDINETLRVLFHRRGKTSRGKARSLINSCRRLALLLWQLLMHTKYNKIDLNIFFCGRYLYLQTII